MNKVKKISLFIYTFYLVYLPNYGYISVIFQPSYLLFLMATFNIVLLNKRLISFIKKAEIYKLLLVINILLVYLFIINVTNSFELSSLVSNTVFIYNVINYLSLIIWYDKLYSKDEISKYLINIGLVQASLSFLMIIIQPLKNVANTMYLRSENPGLNLAGITNNRIYGLGSGYTVTLPFIQALLAVIALEVFTRTGKIKYFIFSLVLIGSSALNNRTGLMIYLIILLMYLLKWFLTNLTLKRILLITSIMLSILPLSFIILNNDSNEWALWIKTAFDDVIMYFIYGETTGNLMLLAGSFITYPSGVRFFIGTGHRIFGQFAFEKFGVNSDIGYINDLYKGGIVYILILYLTVFSDVVKRLNDRFYSSVLIVFLLLANYKAEQLNGSATLLIILLLGFESTYQTLKNESNTAVTI